MKAIFETVLRLSISGVFVAAIVMIIRLMLKKAPKIYSYLLWAVLLVRLICPVSIESVLSIVPEQVTNISQTQISPQLQQAPVHNPIREEIPSQTTTPQFTPSATTVPLTPEPEKSLELMDILAIIWMVGVAVMLCYFVVSYLRTYLRLKTAVPIGNSIYTSDRIASPFVFGLIKPRIYLPVFLKESDTDYVVLHERTHIRRRDYLIKPLAFFALALHWFNPAVWVSYYLMIKDMEMSCDESVIKHSGGDIRTQYSTTLLQMAVKQSGLVSPTAFGESNTSARIKNVIKYKKPVLAISIIAGLAVVIGVVTLVTNPVSAALDTDTLEQLLDGHRQMEIFTQFSIVDGEIGVDLANHNQQPTFADETELESYLQNIYTSSAYEKMLLEGKGMLSDTVFAPDQKYYQGSSDWTYEITHSDKKAATVVQEYDDLIDTTATYRLTYELSLTKDGWRISDYQKQQRIKLPEDITSYTLEQIKSLTQIDRITEQWLSDSTGILRLPEPSYNPIEARGFYGSWTSADGTEDLNFQGSPDCDLEYMFTGYVYDFLGIFTGMIDLESDVYIFGIIDEQKNDLYLSVTVDGNIDKLFRLRLDENKFSLDNDHLQILYRTGENTGGTPNYVGVMEMNSLERNYGISPSMIYDISYTDTDGIVWKYNSEVSSVESGYEYVRESDGYLQMNFYTTLVNDKDDRQLYVCNSLVLVVDQWQSTVFPSEEALREQQTNLGLHLLPIRWSNGGRTAEIAPVFRNEGVSIYEADLDEVREYFYGDWYWNGELANIYNDCEENDLRWLARANFYHYENTISMMYTAGGAGQLYWLDKNNPDTMYYIMDFTAMPFNIELDYNGMISKLEKRPSTHTKTDPNYLSPIELVELARRLDPQNSSNVPFHPSYTDKNDILWVTTNVYLVSENPLTLRTVLMRESGPGYPEYDEQVPLTYTVVQKNGEWVTEFDPPETPSKSVAELRNALYADAYLDQLTIRKMEGDNGYYYVNVGFQEFTPELFRQYFFGQWVEHTERHSWLYDFSDGSLALASSGYTVWLSDELLGTYFVNGGVPHMFYLNINEPDVMYGLASEGAYDGENGGFEMICGLDYIKSADNIKYVKLSPPTPRTDNRLGRIMMSELSRKHGIGKQANNSGGEGWSHLMSIQSERDLFLEVEYIDDDDNRWFMHDPYFLEDVYLLSESENELKLSTILYLEGTTKNQHLKENRRTVEYRIVRENGEWKQEILSVGVPYYDESFYGT